MQKVANLESVARACQQLQADGQKITGRAVVGVTGGSLGTVLSLIKEWRQGADKDQVAQPEDIPAELQAALVRAIGFAQDKAAEVLKEKIADASTREAEALEGLAEAETRITSLTNQLAEVMQQAVEKDQAADRAAAVAAEKIRSMVERVQALETERRQLIESSEASRKETAKALMQVERADLATEKAESRLQAMERQVAECSAKKTEAEKIAAVAEQRSKDMTDQLTETRVALSETKNESKALSVQLSKEVQELREANKSLEIKIAGLVARAEATRTALPVSSEKNKK